MSAGYCPSDINTGFIEIIGPINPIDLKTIEINSYPLSISFAPRTTIPSLVGNRIDESAENTISYKGDRFSLIDTQICSATHKGYTLPGLNKSPVAELILSFNAKTTASSLQQLSGVLMCIPIYESSAPSHNAYLSQLINAEAPSCKYTQIQGGDYRGGDYQSLENSSLLQCVKSCCNDPKCMAYTHDPTHTKCYLKSSIPNLLKTTDTVNLMSGTVNHSLPGVTCSSSNSDDKTKVANLQTIFYDSEKDSTQTSFAYKTCFETSSSNTLTSRSLYIVVFPNGINISPQDLQVLLLQLGGSLKPFECPPALRNAEDTMYSYRFSDSGVKNMLSSSSDGLMYRVPISSVSSEFKERFEYFTKPPRLPTSKFNSEVCPYYKTEQYKCVPFNQLSDLSGDYVIPGNSTLQSLLSKQNANIRSELKKPSASITPAEVGDFAGILVGSTAAILLLLYCGSWLSKKA